MKILIVDDDRVSREILNRVASKYGKCDLAVDGIEAVEAFGMAHDRGMPYDVMLLDIMMPLFDGNKVLRSIRAFEGKKNVPKENMVKVIVISALYNNNLLGELCSYDIHEYIRKPVNLELLQKVLGSIESSE